MARKTDYKEIIKGRIQAGIAYQDQAWRNPNTMEATIPELETIPARNMALVRGTYWDFLEFDLDTGAIRRWVNEIYPALSAKHDAIVEGEVEFVAEPTHPDYTEVVDNAIAAVNTFWRSNKVSEITDKCRWECDIAGWGIVRVGWTFKPGVMEVEPPEPEDDAQPLMMVNGGLMGEQIAPGEPPPMMSETGEPLDLAQLAEQQAEASRQTLERKASGVLCDKAYVRRVRPEALIVDPNGSYFDLSDSRYAFEQLFVPLYKLKAMSDYKVPKEIKGTMFTWKDKKWQESCGYTGEASAANDSPEMALVEIYDGFMFVDDGEGQDTLRHFVVAAETWDILYEGVPSCVDPDTQQPFLPFGNSFPFRVLPSRPIDNDEPIPDAAVSQCVEMQIAVDDALTALGEHTSHSSRVVMMDEALIQDEDTKTRILSDFDSRKDLRVVFVPRAMLEAGAVTFPRLQPIDPQVLQVIQDGPIKIRAALGVTEYDTAGIPTKSMTKAEVLRIEQSGGTRTAGDAQRYRRWLEDIAMSLLCFMQAYQTEPLTLGIKKPTGETEWRDVTYRELRGVEADGVTPKPIGIQCVMKFNAERQKSLDSDTHLANVLKAADFLTQAQANGQLPNVDMRLVLNRVLKAMDLPEITSKPGEEPEGEQESPQEKQAAQVIQQLHQEVQAGQAQMEQMKQQFDQQLQLAKMVRPPTIAFNDLPINGRVQVAAMAGIELTPGDFIEQEALEQGKKDMEREAQAEIAARNAGQKTPVGAKTS